METISYPVVTYNGVEVAYERFDVSTKDELEIKVVLTDGRIIYDDGSKVKINFPK